MPITARSETRTQPSIKKNNLRELGTFYKLRVNDSISINLSKRMIYESLIFYQLAADVLISVLLEIVYLKQVLGQDLETGFQVAMAIIPM